MLAAHLAENDAVIDWTGKKQLTPETVARLKQGAELERQSRNNEAKMKGKDKPLTGSRGGRYTEGTTKDGKTYRRYF